VSVILPTDAIRDAEERIEGASAPGLAEVGEDE
jgi:hypothetical protein